MNKTKLILLVAQFLLFGVLNSSHAEEIDFNQRDTNVYQSDTNQLSNQKIELESNSGSTTYPPLSNKLKEDTVAWDDNNRFEMYERELQKLISKVEILEHKVLELSNKTATSNTSTISNTDSQNNEHISDSPEDSTKITKSENASTPTKENNKKTTSSDKEIYESALSSLKEAGPIVDKNIKTAKLEEAEEQFINFINQYPKSKFTCNANFWIGETYYHRNNHNKAAINFLKSYKCSKNIKSDVSKSQDALLKLALSLGELKKYQDACGILEKLEIEFPKRPADSIKRTKDARIKFNCKKINAY